MGEIPSEEKPTTTSKSTISTGRSTIESAAASAQEAQPKGITLATTQVKTKMPFLLRGELREYQVIGLDWLVAMYDKNLNGILADEMGLGKTIQTIALLAYLACERQIWGPHLIIVPSSVLLNWEIEFKKWCPAFKILTYFGNPKQRRLKRIGWTKPNAFHVCLTSYKIVLRDQHTFKRKKWHYLILDEAQHIKNFKSQCWQTLLNFRSKRRLLLTGTPLQNDLMELWSLMHFLMPNIFQSHKEFKDWFSNPVTNMIEGNEKFSGDLINRLHSVLRPFLLRRLKKDVEKQLPAKHEHIVMCRLSKRQRFLYDEFISNANTKKTLESGNYLGIANILMQLRKVCNHPDLFEPRPIVSPFDQLEPILCYVPSLAVRALEKDPLNDVSLENFNFNLASCECNGMSRLQYEETNRLRIEPKRILQLGQLQSVVPDDQSTTSNTDTISNSNFSFLSQNVRIQGAFDVYERAKQERTRKERQERYQFAGYLNELRCDSRPLYGSDLIRCVQVKTTTSACLEQSRDPKRYLEYSNALRSMILTPEEREQAMQETITHFVFNIPKARAPPPQLHCSHPNPSTRFETESLTHSKKQILCLISFLCVSSKCLT